MIGFGTITALRLDSGIVLNVETTELTSTVTLTDRWVVTFEEG